MYKGDPETKTLQNRASQRYWTQQEGMSVAEGLTKGDSFSCAPSPSGTADTCPGTERLVAKLSLEEQPKERNRLFSLEGDKQETLGSMQRSAIPSLAPLEPSRQAGRRQLWPVWMGIFMGIFQNVQEYRPASQHVQWAT